MSEQSRFWGTSREIVETARVLRRRQTPAEARLWEVLRNRQVTGYRVRRQQPFGPYVIDFWVAPVRLAIELDGTIHDEPAIAAQDAAREAWLEAHDIAVVRFRNEEILHHLDTVIARIEQCVVMRETELREFGSFRREKE